MKIVGQVAGMMNYTAGRRGGVTIAGACRRSGTPSGVNGVQRGEYHVGR